MGLGLAVPAVENVDHRNYVELAARYLDDPFHPQVAAISSLGGVSGDPMTTHNGSGIWSRSGRIHEVRQPIPLRPRIEALEIIMKALTGRSAVKQPTVG